MFPPNSKTYQNHSANPEQSPIISIFQNHPNTTAKYSHFINEKFHYCRFYSSSSERNSGVSAGLEGFNYRYHFNNKETDNEVIGEGNSYDFGARMYDSRLGRWWSPDKLAYKYYYLSPYSFAANNPIIFFDMEGDDFFAYSKKDQRKIIRILNKTFGKDHGFTFDDNGKLIHSVINIYTGRREQEIVYDYFKEKIIDNSNVIVTFRGFNYEYVNVDGNLFYVGDGNAITVQRMVDGKLFADIAIGPKQRNALLKEGVLSSKASGFWAEVGHPIATILLQYDFSNQARKLAARWTVGFENIARTALGEAKRSGSTHGAKDRFGNVIEGSSGADNVNSLDNYNYDIRPPSENEVGGGNINEG